MPESPLCRQGRLAFPLAEPRAARRTLTLTHHHQAPRHRAGLHAQNLAESAPALMVTISSVYRKKVCLKVGPPHPEATSPTWLQLQFSVSKTEYNSPFGSSVALNHVALKLTLDFQVTSLQVLSSHLWLASAIPDSRDRGPFHHCRKFLWTAPT